MNSINNKLAALRLALKEQNIDAIIIPGSDPHQSEYVAEHWQFRKWISGFSGSAGYVFITQDYAGLSTDSRYFLQAEEELADSEFVLHKQKIAHNPQIVLWLKNNLAEGAQIAIDPRLFSANQIKTYEKQFQEAGMDLCFSKEIIDSVWKSRPSLPNNEAFELDLKYAGKTRADKISEIRKKMLELDVKHHLITTLDDIAWTFNLRGNDVEFNPVVNAYAIIGEDNSYLFINDQKLSSLLIELFESESISILPYESINDFLEKTESSESILIDPTKTNGDLYAAAKHLKIIHGENISTALKARKNAVEVENIKKAMLKDGVALTRLYIWLEKEIANRTVPETEVAIRLADFRKEQGAYHGESFSAIVGYKGNGAIVHYRAKEETCASIKPEGILLLDSGGQYWCGTTDITRTTALGEPSEIQKRDYTLVLKGHISLAMLKFPHGTRGNQMELLARKSLWEHGLNYGHGTGHGVGFFLNVHEGPQALGSGATAKAATVIEPGMFTSNEPGFYKAGEYGIRIENLVLCVEDKKTVYGQFLKFDTLTLFPIDTSLIDFPLLTKEEVEWLNSYHAKVLKKLSPLLNEEERAWMETKCKAI